MKIVLIYSLMIVLMSLALIQCGKQDETVVVTVGELNITDEQILDVLKIKYPNRENYNEIEIEQKKELLEPLIKKSLRVNAAYDLGLDEDDKFKRTLNDQKMRIMGSKYYEKEIIDKLVPESEIEKILIRQAVELRTSHILIGFKGTRIKSDRTRDEAEKLVTDILNEMEAGADFSTTAQKYSDDPSVKSNNGDLGYFTWGRMVGPYQEAAWNLNIGEISDRVETIYGFHIIKLDDRRDVPDYVADRSQKNIIGLKQALLKAKGDSARIQWRIHYANLKEDYHYVLYNDSINFVLKLIKDKAEVGKVVPGTFTSQQKEITLAEYDGDKITLGTLIELNKDKLSSALGKLGATGALNNEVERLSRDRMVMLAIKDKGFDKLPDVVKEVRQFTEEQLNRLVEQKAVALNVDPSEEEVKNYFNKNSDSFKIEAEIEMWEVFTTDIKIAEEVARRARQGSNFEGLSKKYSEDKISKKAGGYVGYKKVSGRGLISREAHKLGPGGKIGGPIKYRRGWTVIKTGKKREETLMDFEEAKSRAKSLLKKEQTLQAKTKWEAGLKEKYTVLIDEEKLKEI